MFFRSKFSILKAWLTSLTITFDNIIFYIAWNIIAWTIGMFLFALLGVAMGIFDIQALMQDYSWIQKFILSLFRSISFNSFKSIKEVAGHEPYDILKMVFPENILNHVLEHKSWSEYVNVILLPNKVMISLVIMLMSIISMTITIGYIKTALKFQNDQKASFRDMYRYFYLLPQYFLVKLIIFSVVLFFVLIFLLFISIVAIGFVNPKSFFFSILMFTAVNAIYQRIKFMQYLVVDQNMSAFKACKASWNLTKGSWIYLFFYSLIDFFLLRFNFFTKTIGKLGSVFYSNINKQAEVSIYKQLNQ